MTRTLCGRRRAEGLLTATGLALAAGCALVLVCCLVAPTPAAAAEAGAGAVVHASPWESAAAEARVLADRILRRESDDLLLDGSRQRALGYEIKRVLSLIRRSNLAMADVSVREDHAPATLVLGLEGALRDAVAALWGGEAASAAPPTGHAAFDALNATLGFRSVRPYPALGAVALHLDERVNIEAAMRAYGAIDGVAHAEPDTILGDGSDIEAIPVSGGWLVVFRKAWGDCPSGCINEELSFFSVAGDRFTQFESAQARDMEAFATLLARRGWR